jgi:hypothetical protein
VRLIALSAISERIEGGGMGYAASYFSIRS